MEERIDVMTDYQMRTLLNLIIEIVEENQDKPKKILERLTAIRDGKTGDKKNPEE